MAGKVVVSTLNNDTGVLATQNGMTGIAKAWANFGYVSSAMTTRSSFNVSSVTRTAAGQYAVNFTTAMANANYATLTSTSSMQNGVYGKFAPIVGVTGTTVTPTTSSVTVFSTYTSGVFDEDYISVAVFGS
jgi:hypothetical protein